MYNLCPTTLQLPLFPVLHAIDDETDRPTLIKCVTFRGRERMINIPQEIGVQYFAFGCLLLEDVTGTRIRSIVHKTREDIQHTNIAILEQWISGEGRQPVTWKILTEVLRDIGLSTLAADIEAVKCDSEESEAVKNTESSKH